MGGFRQTIPDLAAIRESRGISLAEITRSTKINGYYLRAIEDGDIRKLPEGVYVRSYIRQYARAIDYNEDDLLEKYGVAVREETPVETPPVAQSGWLARFVALLFHAHGSRWTG